MNPGTAYRRLKTLLEEAGLPSIRFHDLRHTFATHALTSGVDAKTLAGILGEREGTVFPDGEVAAVAFIRQRSRFRLPGNVQGGKAMTCHFLWGKYGV